MAVKNMIFIVKNQ